MSRFRLNEGALHRVLRSQDGPVGRQMARIAVRVESAAKGHCPVDTGRLRSSITWQFAEADGELCVRIGTNVEYAVYVHDGTSRMAARPFLEQGLHDVVG